MPNRKTQDCERSSNFYANDDPTILNNLHARSILSLLSFFILGTHFGQIGNGFFTSVAIYALPMVLDLSRFRPRDKVRLIIKRLHTTLLLLIFLICVLGLIGILTIYSFDSGTPHIMVQQDYAVAGGACFKAIYLWIAVFVSWLLSALDVFTFKSSVEESLNTTRA